MGCSAQCKTFLDKIKPKKGWLYFRNSVGFFFIGLINNINFVIVNSSAHNLCELFNAHQYNSLILWCNVFMGLVLRIFNMTILYKIRVKVRILCCTIFCILGLLGISLSIILQEVTQTETYWLFVFCLCMILVVGGIQAFAQSVIVSYLGRFEPEIVNWWSSGTGLAGLAGSGVYLLLSSLNVPDKITFIGLTPLCVIYVLLFFFFVKPSDVAGQYQDIEMTATNEHTETEQTEHSIQSNGEDMNENEENDTLNDSTRLSNEPSTEKSTLLNQAETAEGEIDLNAEDTPKSVFDDEVAEEGTFWEKLKEAFKQTWWLGLNLTLVYFFEYVSSPGANYVSVLPEVYTTSTYWFIANYYEVLAFMYQVGVFVSRSSLPLFKLKPVWILTILQFILTLIMTLNGNLHFFVDKWGIWFLMFMMLAIGLIGGTSYVQCSYWVLKKEMKKETRELGVTFVNLLNSIGILAASALSLLFNHTIWSAALPDRKSVV